MTLQQFMTRLRVLGFTLSDATYEDGAGVIQLHYAVRDTARIADAKLHGPVVCNISITPHGFYTSQHELNTLVTLFPRRGDSFAAVNYKSYAEATEAIINAIEATQQRNTA